MSTGATRFKGCVHVLTGAGVEGRIKLKMVDTTEFERFRSARLRETRLSYIDRHAPVAASAERHSGIELPS
jgi:hypothetical protein